MNPRRWLVAVTIVVVGAVAAVLILNGTGGPKKPDFARFSSSPARLLPPNALPDSSLLLSPTGREQWLDQVEQTLAVAHARPRRIAVFSSFVSATKTSVTVRALPITVPNGIQPQVYAAYDTAPRQVTFDLPPGVVIHLTQARDLADLRPDTPLLIGGVRAKVPGGLRLQLVTDLGDLARAANRSPSQAEGSQTVTPTVVADNQAASYQLAADTTSTGVSEQPPPQGVLIENNRVGWPGMDWTGALHLGDENGCPYLTAGLEVKAGLGAEWHWPFVFHVDSPSSGISVAGRDQPESSPLALGAADPGADQAYYFGAGVAAGLQITIGCHINVAFIKAGGDFTLADLGVKAMLSNETSRHAPISGESDLPVPPTDCIAFGAQPLKSIPSWVPFADKLKQYAEVAISGCADLHISGGLFRSLVHAVGPAAGATPQGVALRASGSATVHPLLTGGRSITVDRVNYQPLLHIGVTPGIEVGSNAAATLALGDKLQAALKGSSVGKSSIGRAASAVISGIGRAGTSCSSKPDVPRFAPDVLACDLANLGAAVHVSIDWPHPLEMTSPTIVGQPVTLNLDQVAGAPSATVAAGAGGSGHSPSVMCFNSPSPAVTTPTPEQAPASCPIFGEPEIDANLIILSHVHWTNWGQGTTVGSGTAEEINAGPSARPPVPVTVALSDLAPRCNGQLFYTQLVAHVQGQQTQTLNLSGGCQATTPQTRTTSTTSLIGTFGNPPPPYTPNSGHVVDVTVTDAQYPNGDPSATGSVTVRLNNRTGQIIGSATIHSGRARWELGPGDPGDNSVAAYYSGDATHKPSATCLLYDAHNGQQCP